jgi:hypothetical protein
MSCSILEVLQNADYNINESKMGFQTQIGKTQLHNAVELLNKGYTLEDDFDEVMGESEDVEKVPEKSIK